jgi:hypothetical protein
MHVTLSSRILAVLAFLTLASLGIRAAHDRAGPLEAKSLLRVRRPSILDAILAIHSLSAGSTRIRQEICSSSNLHSAKEEAMKRCNHNKAFATDEGEEDEFDVNSLLHPAQAFAHPSDVVNDCDLTLSEKRAILASWASNACAVEANPALRRTPACTPVCFDDILDALRTLDRQAAQRCKPVPHYRRVLERRSSVARGRTFRRNGESGDQGSRLN